MAGLSFLWLFAGSALAHGVGYRGSAFSPVALEFFYSTGEAMSYREARVFSPADEKFANQTGRTDAAGRFAFVPDAAGLWRVIVKDEEGHQATAEINVTDADLSKAAGQTGAAPMTGSGNPPEGLELAVRAILGVSLLFNAAAFVSLTRRRKREA